MDDSARARLIAVVWLAAAGLALPPGAAGAECARIDDPLQVLEFHLEIDPADWEIVRRDATFEIERPALFRCGDGEPQPVNVRRKVSGALPSDQNPLKVSLKIDFDDLTPGGEWRGRRKISLENGISDPVYPSAILREGVAWILMARAGVIAGGCSWVRLRVNGEPAGVYVRLDQIDKSYLRRHIGEDEGFLYKIDRKSRDVKRRLTREGEVDPYEPDLCFPPFDNACPVPADGLAALRRHLDIRQLIAMGAVNTFLANTDGYLESDNNYYWYNSEQPRLYFPWDLDLGLLPWNLRNPPHASEVERLLFEAAPPLREYFDRVLVGLLDGPFSPEALDRLMEEVVGAAGPSIAGDPLNGLAGGFAAEALRLRSWLLERSRFLRSRLPALPPEPVVINEVLASNLGTSRDEAGEAADWVELLNRGAAPVSLDGYYLSDDPAQPRKFRLPPAVLPPGGRVIIWCDHDIEQGPLHAGFNLDRDGEAVGLYVERDGLIRAADFVRFGPQETDVSLGRFPDGDAVLRRLPCPSPAAANRIDCPELPARFIRGDASRDKLLDGTDAVLILGALFLGERVPCWKAADANDDGVADVTDAVHVLLHLFLGEPPPPPPYPACGRDPTPDPLDCRDEGAC